MQTRLLQLRHSAASSAFICQGTDLQRWEASPKFLLEPVPFTWLSAVATSELHPFPHQDGGRAAEQCEKACTAADSLLPQAGLQAPVQSVQELTVTLNSY